MSDPVLPLGGARFDGLIAVEEVAQGMIALRGTLDAEPIRTAVTALTGATMPGPREATAKGDRGLLWMSPDELLILVPRADAAQAAKELADTLSGEHALVADASDARALFELTGDDARLRETLAKLSPADTAPASLPPGTLRRTRLAQVPAAFWLTGPGSARVMCFRSVARYAFDLLSHAAAPDAAVNL